MTAHAEQAQRRTRTQAHRPALEVGVGGDVVRREGGRRRHVAPVPEHRLVGCVGVVRRVTGGAGVAGVAGRADVVRLRRAWRSSGPRPGRRTKLQPRATRIVIHRFIDLSTPHGGWPGHRRGVWPAASEAAAGMECTRSTRCSHCYPAVAGTPASGRSSGEIMAAPRRYTARAARRDDTADGELLEWVPAVRYFKDQAAAALPAPRVRVTKRRRPKRGEF